MQKGIYICCFLSKKRTHEVYRLGQKARRNIYYIFFINIYVGVYEAKNDKNPNFNFEHPVSLQI